MPSQTAWIATLPPAEAPDLHVGALLIHTEPPHSSYRYVAQVCGRPHQLRVVPLRGDTHERHVPRAFLRVLPGKQ